MLFATSEYPYLESQLKLYVLSIYISTQVFPNISRSQYKIKIDVNGTIKSVIKKGKG